MASGSRGIMLSKVCKFSENVLLEYFFLSTMCASIVLLAGDLFEDNVQTMLSCHIFAEHFRMTSISAYHSIVHFVLVRVMEGQVGREGGRVGWKEFLFFQRRRRILSIPYSITLLSLY